MNKKEKYNELVVVWIYKTLMMSKKWFETGDFDMNMLFKCLYKAERVWIVVM